MTASRRTVGQSLLGVLMLALDWWFAHNVHAGLSRQGITLGFGFLRQPANFDIGETSGLRFTPEDTVSRAIAVGLLNTARVALVGSLLALALGFIVGTLRLVDNKLLSGLMRWGVELMRNTPLLLLLFLLIAILHAMPPPTHAVELLPGVFLSDRGLALPFPDRPRLAGFNFVGGTTLSPEFAALVGALVLHHGAHISEVVRGAILAVSRGQRDAALALGMSRWQVSRLVVIPQALRAMVPLLATNCVSLIKNSSLAVAIGFPDVVSVLNTTANQTGHGVETMVIMLAVYLVLSLGVASMLNVYNAHILRRGA